MLEVVANEFFGLLLELHRKDGRMQNALSIPAIMMWIKHKYLLESRFAISFSHKHLLNIPQQNRFNIHLHPPTVTFLYLTTREWVLASKWPRFTLLGQSVGSL